MMYCAKNRTELRTEDDVWAFARQVEAKGDRTLLSFMLGRRDLPLLMAKAVKAGDVLDGGRKGCERLLDILASAARDMSCVCASPALWRKAADEVVHWNGYWDQELQTAILEALDKGRGKMRNIFVIGETNRAKSYVFKPLQSIFRTMFPYLFPCFTTLLEPLPHFGIEAVLK